ncbi:TetR/AcrR family transcriptional regulator [Pseudonocardiaceae bacterium YIM PH 21723]|nr:TetR/AcrR family transcriptional regulator [Pseudonocardiaceae bacterium YIM PH 21723]
MTETRRRGRRPSGADTKTALIEAATEAFAAQGYDKATVRDIAGRAGVDPAMVNHWFGGKEGLFAAAMQIPVNPAEIIEGALRGGREHAGEQLVRTFLHVWDTTGGGVFAGLVRSVAGHELAAKLLREFVTRFIFGRLAKEIGADRPELRGALTGSQMVGLGMMRYVVKLEPIASADHDTLARAIGPTIQRYLTGDIDI